MRLTRRFDGVRNALENIEAVLADIVKCIKI
jgi:hypothetical protein